MIFQVITTFSCAALAGGETYPVVGALVHNAGSVLVIINSLLLLTWKEK